CWWVHTLNMGYIWRCLGCYSWRFWQNGWKRAGRNLLPRRQHDASGHFINLYAVPLSLTVKQLLMLLAVSILPVLALWLSFALLGMDFFDRADGGYLYLGLANIASVMIFYRIGLYRALLLYVGLQAGFIVLQGVTI